MSERKEVDKICFKYSIEVEFLDYVINVLNDSRSKRQALARLLGLKSLRQESLFKIKGYIRQKEKEKQN